MRLLLTAITALLALTIPTRGFPSDSLYRPLSKRQFEAFDAEYWQLADCQKAYLAKHVTGEQLVARLVEQHVDSEIIAIALRLLPPTDPFAKMLGDSSLPQTARVAIAMGGLGSYAGQESLLPSQAMRAFGVVRKYTAVGISPACQPSPKFLSTLKVMLDEDF